MFSVTSVLKHFLLNAGSSNINDLLSYVPTKPLVRTEYTETCSTFDVARLHNIPHSCCMASREHSCISSISAVSYCIRSTKCLRREAVNTDEFAKAAKQKRCDHSCLRCTSAAVMFPPRGHNKKSRSIWGQTVNHSQQGRCTSQPKSAS